MTTITVNIETYGVVKTVLPSTLSLMFNQGNDVYTILKQIGLDYPKSMSLLEQCACAMGDEIISRSTVLNTDCTLVLLSPVAGG
ncbi:MoaD/ThiS family protein [Acinetobacter sp. B10A]|uniref:MoaD/ThiS family protein n=1 Tax=Acinetobacter baretiae TaxID=2605383 RepID=UPI001B3C5F60|nr:MoaD/ThiS family protein [Acinetobacter baretiae]MBF7685846.1 MoaD/ThiS family protein [Acinetobacter baretiae]